MKKKIQKKKKNKPNRKAKKSIPAKRSNKTKKVKVVKSGKKNVKKIESKKKIKFSGKKVGKTKKHKKLVKMRRKTRSYSGSKNINSSRKRILALALSIIFVLTGMAFMNVINGMKVQKTKQSAVVYHAPVKKENVFEKEIKKMVEGYPIETMTPFIAEKNPKTAAFLVAIAKKESNWGKRKPVLNGEDCYNYWGFRLKSDRMGSGGHTCFDSPEEAVDIVATRIDELVSEEKVDTPSEMVVWKCGSSCAATGGQAAANKWISDVGYYYNKFSKFL